MGYIGEFSSARIVDGDGATPQTTMTITYTIDTLTSTDARDAAVRQAQFQGYRRIT